MVDSADEPPLSSHQHSWAKNKTPSSWNPLRTAHEDPGSTKPSSSTHIGTETVPHHVSDHPSTSAAGPAPLPDHHVLGQDNGPQNSSVVDKEGDGAESSPIGTTEPKASLVTRFARDAKRIIFASWINWLLVFVPVGIILGVLVDWVHIEAVSPSVVFAINAVAIIPLASLLAFATESVATKLGDTIGALLNVTFGNAVELIIFIIALVAKEVRVVQAAALGSILSNLLLILGMCFVAGGLRFREQLYNSAASQTSACLLCLSVISLVLPTAFHASFSSTATADHVVLKVSRGTSVVLLLVYLLYLVFQLKSHAFMYKSTPQHIIDEESYPGVLADILNSSTSSSDNSSSSGSDSDSSRGSHTTAKRIKRALRRKRRKSISSAKDNVSVLRSFPQTPSSVAHSRSLAEASQPATSREETGATGVYELEPVVSGDEADVDGEGRAAAGRPRFPSHGIQSRDFETQAVLDDEGSERRRRKKGSKKNKKTKRSKRAQDKEKASLSEADVKGAALTRVDSGPQVAFISEVEIPGDGTPRRPFTIRNISEAVRPAFNSSVFPHHQATGRSLPVPISVVMRPASQPRPSSHVVRRTSSLPDILHHTNSNSRSALAAPVQPLTQAISNAHVEPEVEVENIVDTKEHLSQTSAIVLLVITTTLVALCAEFLVGSIDYLIAHSGVSQTFIGLIILPIVGNAAEHVTAVTVAAKNKMDLAINIALGSSIQIALFVTPLMVILGWIIKTDMSLYFSLFETVSLFASAFIVSFLMIDGRSNYLEGALLIAAYVIIAVGAFFYPSCDLSSASGPLGDTSAAC